MQNVLLKDVRISGKKATFSDAHFVNLFDNHWQEQQKIDKEDRKYFFTHVSSKQWGKLKQTSYQQAMYAVARKYGYKLTVLCRDKDGFNSTDSILFNVAAKLKKTEQVVKQLVENKEESVSKSLEDN